MLAEAPQITVIMRICFITGTHMSTQKMGQGMIALAFIIGIGLLTVFFADVEQRQHNPNRTPQSKSNINGAEVNLKRNRQGHYIVTVQINRQPVEFLLDTAATAVLIPDARDLAERVCGAVDRQLASLDRAEVIRTSLDARGGAVVASSLDEALDLASDFAAEHACLHLREAARYIDRIRNAGCIFAGASSAESIGDHTAGPSHALPAGGTATVAPPLGAPDLPHAPPTHHRPPHHLPESYRRARPSAQTVVSTRNPRPGIGSTERTPPPG